MAAATDSEGYVTAKSFCQELVLDYMCDDLDGDNDDGTNDYYTGDDEEDEYSGDYDDYAD